MGQAGESAEALDEARRVLADRDAGLADADRALIAAVAEVHAIAVESIGRIDAISARLESATGRPVDTAAGAREISHTLVAANREIAEVVNAARAAVDAKTVALRELTERYSQR